MDLEKAIAHWRRTDPVLAGLAADFDEGPRPEDQEDAFAALVQAICHQQVSLAAGRAIFARVAAATGPTPGGVLDAGEERLRGCGLSRPKVGYVLDLAGHVTDGTLDLASLSALPDEDVIQRLVAVKGIGVWSAKMHMIFHMGRPDVCPWEDLGVQLAVVAAYGVPKDDVVAFIKDQAASWSPFSSLAARVLWHSRRAP